MRIFVILWCCFVVVSHSSLASADSRQVSKPQATTGYLNKSAYVASEYMISAANPFASWAGKKIIERGGNAIDAAVAMQATLTLVEPQSSGIGGGSFILYWDNKNKILHTFDGRETAPYAASTALFNKDSKLIARHQAGIGGRAVGVPGTLKVLELAHSKFGSLRWRDLFLDTIELATSGFQVSQRLHTMLAQRVNQGLLAVESSKEYFYPNGQALQAGTLQKNIPLARVLSEVAQHGSDYFYKGAIAKKIVQAVQTSAINPGVLNAVDMKEYAAKTREPACGEYRSYVICGMPPPSSGGISIVQILKILEGYPLRQYRPNQLQAVHLITQASRLAFADRQAFVADPDYIQLPFAALLNRGYLQTRAKLIDTAKDMPKARAGEPYGRMSAQPDSFLDLPSTSHFSVVDKQGNVVAMSSSIDNAFGSGLLVEGFLLNSQLADFAFLQTKDYRQAINRVEPGKRPRSAMSPTMVFDKNGELYLVLGSAGSSRIINYVAQTLIGVLDWELDIQQAINLPKFTHRNDYTALELDTPIAELRPALEKMGHQVQVLELNSGLHGILLKDGKLFGGADPRRDGVVVGD